MSTKSKLCITRYHEQIHCDNTRLGRRWRWSFWRRTNSDWPDSQKDIILQWKISDNFLPESQPLPSWTLNQFYVLCWFQFTECWNMLWRQRGTSYDQRWKWTGVYSGWSCQWKSCWLHQNKSFSWLLYLCWPWWSMFQKSMIKLKCILLFRFFLGSSLRWWKYNGILVNLKNIIILQRTFFENFFRWNSSRSGIYHCQWGCSRSSSFRAWNLQEIREVETKWKACLETCE